MSQNDNNKTGFIILMLVFIAAFLFVNPIFRFSCARMFMHDYLGVHNGNMSTGLVLTNFHFVPLTILFVLWVAVAVWTYRDAERRNHNGLLWGLFVFIGNVVGLIVYLILRSSSPEVGATAVAAAPAKCPSCSAPIQKSYVACPHCGASLSKVCSQCGKRVESDWKVCPYCENDLKG
ncbi:MAG: zinc ribbon domain-containing protein [Candidatus Latescibacterota bacterium]|jgi:hypothetical protein